MYFFGARVGNQMMIHLHVTSSDNVTLCNHSGALKPWVFQTTRLDQTHETLIPIQLQNFQRNIPFRLCGVDVMKPLTK